MNSREIFPSPLLVPSFSSKGNLYIYQDDSYVSDNYSLLEVLGSRVSQSYLISSYDYYYGLMPNSPELLPLTDYLFVDSGGYETSMGYEANERFKFNYHVCEWDKDKMKEVYSALYGSSRFSSTKLVFTTFDLLEDFDNQLCAAQELQSLFPNAIIDFLIKTHSGLPLNQVMGKLSVNIESLNKIHVLGFTEKELGDTIIERLLSLLRIKLLLNGLQWQGVIHLFGGLEPSLIRLYYYAGADIIDGLSWQRLRFSNGTHLFNPEQYDPSEDEIVNRLQMMMNNLSAMYDISLNLSGNPSKRNAVANSLCKYLESDCARSIHEIENKGGLR